MLHVDDAVRLELEICSRTWNNQIRNLQESNPIDMHAEIERQAAAHALAVVFWMVFIMDGFLSVPPPPQV